MNMESHDPRDPDTSPETDLEASISSASGKGGKMPSQGGEVMDIEYFSDSAEGKKKRRRGRLIIFVDESEERTRWVPWVLLAAMIVAAVVAAVVIIRFAVNSDDGTQSSASKVVNLSNGKYSRYEECAPMMARLRQTSQEHDFSPEISHQTRLNKRAFNKQDTPEVLQYASTSDGQHDVAVPLVDDVLNLVGDALPVPDGDGHMYITSGKQLKVISLKSSGGGADAVSDASVVAATLDFSALPAFDFSATLSVSGVQGSIPIQYGLGSTFKAKQLYLLPAAEASTPRLLAVVGSATNAAPVFPGPSPRLKFDPDGPTYASPDLRPFNTTVVILVDVSNTLNPTVVSVSEFEGHFVTIDQEQSHLWVFIRSSAHIPADHNSADDSQLATDMMPLFRNLPVGGEDPAVSNLPWRHMGDCSNVERLELGVPRAYDNYLLAAIPVLVKSVNQAQIGVVQAGQINLIVQGWAAGMVPVLTAKASDMLNLYLAEGIRYSTQPTSSAASTASIVTAVSHFRLSGGNMTFSNYTTNDGELQFQGAMHFLKDPSQLSLLTSQVGDSSSGSPLQSALTVYSRSLNAEYTALGQFREREPTGLVYPTDKHVFISFAVKTLPLIQVVPMRGMTQSLLDDPRARDSRRAQALDKPQQSVQRLFTNEYVNLMKAIVVDQERANAGYVLLVAGQKVTSAEDASSLTANTDVQDVSRGTYQFSLYSYTPLTASAIQILETVNITSGNLISEAFLDPRAGLLFVLPGDTPGRAYFALPVGIDSDTDLLAGLGCSSENAFNGTLVWRLGFNYTARAGLGSAVDVQPLAAIPAWGACGYASEIEYDDAAVKRIRLLEVDGVLRMTSISRCTLSSVEWPAIAQSNVTSGAPGPWKKVIPETEQLFLDDCPELPT